MSGSEAAGFGELAYGAARDAAGLVLVATVGAAGFGAALFDDGACVITPRAARAALTRRLRRAGSRR